MPLARLAREAVSSIGVMREGRLHAALKAVLRGRVTAWRCLSAAS